nr:immunoglobulin heavy chain junction region [Macaca mulatta]
CARVRGVIIHYYDSW